MPSSSLLSFPDVKEVFERALDSKRGVRLTFSDKKMAQRFIFRCHAFRSLDRKENKKIYPEPIHTLHGRSVFDTLQVLLLPPTAVDKDNLTEEELAELLKGAIVEVRQIKAYELEIEDIE